MGRQQAGVYISGRGWGIHRHMSEQRVCARKHSQYFFRQREFLQLQPLM